MNVWPDIFVYVVQSQKPSKTALDGLQPFCLKRVKVRAEAANKASEGWDHTGRGAVYTWPCIGKRAPGSLQPESVCAYVWSSGRKAPLAVWQKWLAEFVTLLSSQRHIFNSALVSFGVWIFAACKNSARIS